MAADEMRESLPAVTYLGELVRVYRKPASGRRKSTWIAVYHNGVLIGSDVERAIAARWSEVRVEHGPGPKGERLCLHVRKDDGTDVRIPLEGYSDNADLVRALVWRRRPVDRRTRRVVVGAAVALVLIPVAWMLWSRYGPVRTASALPETVAGFVETCEGRGTAYPQAARYVGPGPHPIVLFVDGRPTSAGPSEEWATDDPSKVQLIGCARTEFDATLIGYCGPYSDNNNYPVYSWRHIIDIYEAANRAWVATVTVTRSAGPVTDCPNFVTVRTHDGRVSSDLTVDPTTEDFDKALAPYVDGPRPYIQ